MTIEHLISQAKNQGFSVYVPEKLTSYFYFSKDNKIGYCQISRMNGISYSTVHKPNTSTGTGFAVDSFDDALLTDSSSIKYNSLNEFLNKHWQPLINI